MSAIPRRTALALLAAAVAACGSREPAGRLDSHPSYDSPANMRALVDRYAASYDVPPALVHRIVQRESKYNPAARNGPYFGLMQIHPQTARIMGYTGAPEGLLDPETNLRYGVKYLRGAWLVSDGSQDRAVTWYSKGYYYEAKRRGLLAEAGLRG